MRKIVAQPIGKTVIGKHGENEATEVLFQKMSDLNASLIVTRNGDAQPSPRVTEVSGNNIVWTVNSWDTDVVGDVLAEVNYTNDSGTVVKSVTFTFVVVESLEEPSGTVPEPYEDWYENVLQASQAAKVAETAAETAQTAAEVAQTGAETAKSDAEDAETQAEEFSSSAGSSATAAASSAEKAKKHEEAAAASASESLENAESASASKEAAASSEKIAKENAEAAASSKIAAATSEANAESFAQAANESAENASGSATASADSATKAEQSATAAAGSSTAASEAQTAAEAARDASVSAKATAESARDDAVSSKTAAASSATAAASSASAASGSASTASTKAEEASGSASAAAASAESIAESAAQIAQNTADIQLINADIVAFEDATFDKTVSPNVFDGEWIDGYMNLKGVVGGTGYYHTNKIATNGNTGFTLTCTNATDSKRYNFLARFITAFDSDENVLDAKGLQNAGTNTSVSSGLTVINIDSSVAYIVVSYYNAVSHPDIMISFDTTVTEYQEYGASYEMKSECLPSVKATELEKYLSGKTIAVFGDSIMYGAGNQQTDGTYKGPGDILADKYGMTCSKYAVSGSTMGVRTDSESYSVDEVHHIAKQIRNAISAGITPDLIIINGGTNDCGWNKNTSAYYVELGEMTKVYTEPTSESLYSDGFETAAYLLKTNFRKVPILYIRAHNMSSRLYDGQTDYGERGISIAEKWGISTCDMYKRMNVQLAADISEYLADYTHPNQTGYDTFYIPAIENWIYEQIVS